jgi:hypothetical protein
VFTLSEMRDKTRSPALNNAEEPRVSATFINRYQ